MKKILLIIMILPVMLYGAFEYVPGGVRFQTMGYTGTATTDDPGAFYFNPSAIAQVGGLKILSSYERRFDFFNMIDIRAALPVSVGKVGIGIEYVPAFGEYTDLNGDTISSSSMLGSETQMSFFYALPLSYFDIGAGVSVYTFNSVISDNDPGAGFHIGMHKKIYNKVDIGLAVNNLFFYNLKSSFATYRVPVEVRMGINYSPYKGVDVALDFSRIEGYPVSIGLGAEYSLFDVLYLRSGINSYPVSIITGFGIEYGKFILNYGFDWISGPGVSHKIEIGVNL